MKAIQTLGVAVFLAVLFSPSVLAAVNIDEFPVFVRPKDNNGNLQPTTSFNYVFNFTTDSTCSNVLLSNSRSITTDKYGVGFANIDVSSLSATTPSYLCEYRGGTLRETHTLNPNYFADDIGTNFSGSFNDLSDVPVNLDTDSTDDFSGVYTDLDFTGTSGLADGVDDDTTYGAGTGLDLTGTTFALDTTYLNNNYVGQTEYPNLDTDDTDDINTVNAAGGLTSTTGTNSVTLNVGQGSGIVVAADNVSVDETVVPFLGDDETVSGAWTFNNDVVINGDLSVVGDTVNLTVQQQIVNGSILPDLNNTFTLGAVSAQWAAVHAQQFYGNIDWSYIINKPANLDTDSTDDLTTSTNFGGDVSGQYNTIALATGSVSDDEIDYSTVTVADFTNDAGYLTSESDPLFSAENSSLARIGTCPAGYFVVNVTTSGVQCEQALTSTALNNTATAYLYDDGNTVFFNETALNATIDAREVDTTCSADGSCSNITYDSETNGWDTNASDDFSGNYTDLDFTGTTGLADGIDNDTTYENLSEFNNDAGYLTSETDPVFTAENSSLARTGTCAPGEFVVNTTTAGVQCAVPADETDGQGINATSGLYLYDDGSTAFFNETTLNNTIDARDDDTTYSNGSGLNLVGTVFSIDSNYFTGWDQNASDDFNGSWNALTDVPAGFADGVDNDTTYENLSEFNNDAGYLTSETDPVYTADEPNIIFDNDTTTWDKNASDDFSGNYTDLDFTGTTGLADGVDNDTQLSEAEVDAFADNNNYVDLDVNPDTDLDSTDDLTTSTAFSGDVSGLYNSITLVSGVVSDNEIDYSTVTLADFTNDAGYLTNETDPVFTAENTSLARVGNCAPGEFVVNTTTAGVQCATPADAQGINATSGLYLYDDGSTAYFNETQLNATIDAREVDTTYSNGTGIDLVGTVFSIDESYFSAWDQNASDDFNGSWNALTDIPAGFADGVDNDTTDAASITITDAEGHFPEDNVEAALNNTRGIVMDLSSAGWVSGGNITNNGNGSINISAGTGYARNEGGHLVYTTWTADQVTLAQGINYIVVDDEGLITVQSTFPTPENILLGRVYLNADGIAVVSAQPRRGINADWYQQEYIQEGIGPLVESGFVSTLNGATNNNLTIGTGRVTTTFDEYDTATIDTYNEYYYNGSNFVLDGTTTKAINYTHWSNTTSGQLEPIPNGSWAKHSIYVDYERDIGYFIFGTELFDTQSEAEEGAFPAIPESLEPVAVGVVGITSDGQSDLTGQLIDIRPILDRLFQSGVVGTIGGQETDHGALTGLSDDDHPQYLLADGSRPLAGDWSGGGFDLLGFHQINADLFIGNLSWTNLTDVPAGFADGVDNDTTYTAGTGLTLTATTFALNESYFDGWDKNASDDFSGNLSDLNVNTDLNMSGNDIVNAQNVSVNECVEGAFGGYVCFNSTHTWIG